jgi:hypothetical protein
MLVWMVIFNHKAESPTFILAVSGIALWFVINRQHNAPEKWLRRGILCFVLVGTSLSVTDLFPQTLRDGIFALIHLKVLPCIAAWILIQWQLWRKILPSLHMQIPQ